MVGHHVFGALLQVGVHRGVDGKAQAIFAAVSFGCLHLGAHMGEQMGVTCARWALLRGAHGAALRHLHLCWRGPLQLYHAIERVVSAVAVAVGVLERGEGVGALHDGAERCGLLQRELVGGGVEVHLGGSADAVDRHAVYMAVVDGVEVGLQDVFFVVLRLDGEGADGLTRLAVDAALCGEVAVLDELLGDGGPALHGAASACVGQGGASDGPTRHPVMFEEAVVFQGEQGPPHMLGKLVELHKNARGARFIE